MRDVALALDCRDFKQAKTGSKELRDLFRILWRLTRDWQVAPQFWRTMLRVIVSNPSAIPSVIKLSALYLHFGPFARHVAATLDEHIVAQVSQWQRFAPVRQKLAPVGLAASDA